MIGVTEYGNIPSGQTRARPGDVLRLSGRELICIRANDCASYWRMTELTQKTVVTQPETK